MKKALLFVCFLCSQFLFSQDRWTLIQAGEDIYNGQLNGGEWPGRWDIESLDMKQVSGGFLTCGYYNNQIFDSTNGEKYDLTGKSGAYLAKYNNDGTLQWLVRTQKKSYEERNLIMSIATDSHNNIYIVGHSDGTLYDTTGNSRPIAPGFTNSPAFLMKFDENGTFIWNILIVGVDPKRVAIDNEDNVVVCGSFWGQNSGQMIFNDQYVGDFSNISDSEVHYYIAKYASDGMPLWDAGILIDSVNDEFIEGVTFDEQNNIYVNGVYELNLKVYDADEQNFIERDWSGHYGGSMFIAKYTPNGDAQWVVNSDDTKLSKIITMPDGSHYISGTNTVYSSGGEHIMTNADATTISQNTYGPFYFAKINADGTWGWLTGSKGTGRGYAVEMLKYGEKIAVMGSLSNWGEEPVNGMIYGTNNSTRINVRTEDAFIATYTLNGALTNVSMSANVRDYYAINGTSGFIRDEDGFFYVQRNMMGFTNNIEKEFYGQMIAPINGDDATITKFKEIDSGTLSSGSTTLNIDRVQLMPNPTDKEFEVSLGQFYPQAGIIITDVSGKKIFEKKYTNTDKLLVEITDVEGIYFVKVNAGNKIKYFKVLKK